MPDWQQIVREHLEARGLPRAVQEEVVCELAAHLEEICEEERRQGRSAADATERVLASVRWRKLARGIRAAKAKE